MCIMSIYGASTTLDIAKLDPGDYKERGQTAYEGKIWKKNQHTTTAKSCGEIDFRYPYKIRDLSRG